MRLRPSLSIAALLAIWQIAIDRHPGQLLPGPIAVACAFVDLLQHGLLFKYVVASLFRVTWGFGLAALLAIPLGLMLGLVSARRNGLLSSYTSISTHFTAGLDSDRDPLVRRRRPRRHFLDFRGMFLSVALDSHERSPRHPRGVLQCRPEFWLEPQRLCTSCSLSGGCPAVADWFEDHHWGSRGSS